MLIAYFSPYVEKYVGYLTDWFQITNAAAMKKAGNSPLFDQTKNRTRKLLRQRSTESNITKST
jgi:hypothetical protein